MKKKLLLLKKFTPSDLAYLTKGLSGHYDLIVPDDYSEDSLARLGQDADVFLGYKVSKIMLDVAAKLKVVQILGAGVDALDLNVFKGTKVAVCNSHSNAPYVAEYAVALMLSLAKKVSLHDRAMRRGSWFKPKNDESDHLYLSDSLIDKTVGLIGCGNVGQNIAKLLQGFSNRFVGFDKNPPQSSQVDFVDLKSVLACADIIFVTLPLTPSTRGLISSSEFKQMKKTAYFVNVSRGPVVDPASLYEALAKKHISGAGIDVWYKDVHIAGDKKYPSDKYPFHKLDNLVMSPYRAGYLKDSSPHLVGVVENLVRFGEEGKLMSVVDLEEGY